MRKMEEDACIDVGGLERHRSARVIVASGSGMRGLENYALDLAIRFVKEQDRERCGKSS